VARDGNPDDDFYGEPTQYANYGGGDSGAEAYSEYSPPQPQFAADYGYQTGPALPHQQPWYRKPASLVALGALGVVMAALVVYAIVSMVGRSPSSTPTGTTTAIPTARPAPATGEATETPAPQAPAPPPPPPAHTETVTVSPTEATTPATTPAPTTTTAEPTTTNAPTTTVAPSVSTVTETVTQTRPRPLWPTLFPRPTIDGGGQ
jgi:outer membrane biosynthesis protein TonB